MLLGINYLPLWEQYTVGKFRKKYAAMHRTYYRIYTYINTLIFIEIKYIVKSTLKIIYNVTLK